MPCDKSVSSRLKGSSYETNIRQIMLYGGECWAIKKTSSQSSGRTILKGKIWKGCIRETFKLDQIDEKMRRVD